ncbi:MAG: phosphoglucosamine mutase [Phycisphaeraceae bacterium]
MSDSKLMLSISGLRGIVGDSLNPEVAARFAAAVGSHFRQATGKEHPLVVLGRDSRPSGLMIEQAAIAGLTATGCRVVVLGIATTPSVAIMVDHLHADGGLVLTASHNPIMWNGIKTLRHDGVAPPPDQAAAIIERFHHGPLDYVDVQSLQPNTRDETTADVHIQRILPHVDVERIRSRKLKVVLDSVHGAGGPATAMLMQELGVELVHLYAQPTGQFPHTPEPTAENLTGLCEAVQEHNADIGLAQDPDADRLALVDQNGVYIGEEYTLALCAEHVLSRTPGPVAANLSTSRMLDDVAARYGCTVHRTPVGEANVADAMKQHHAVVGGEGNGGIIFPPVIHVRDSLSGAALILDLLAASGESLSQLVRRIPAYSIVKDKLPVRDGVAENIGPRLERRFAGEKIDQQDGIRIDTADAWVHVRPSNTEPILRIIAEAADPETARQLIKQVREEIDQL